MGQLNSEQQRAVDTLDGPLLVLAGAGSGKTRVVTFRIANLLNRGVHSSQILGLTFTNKAANEMKERVRQQTMNDVLICTFHSLGVRILRESIHHLGYKNTFVIYDEDDADKLLKICIKELTGADTKDAVKELRNLISSAKNNGIEAVGSTQGTFFNNVFALYQAKLKEFNGVDYDDLLALPVKLFSEHPEILAFYQARWTHLLIDEYQDTNALQYKLVNFLVEKSRNLCVVGDPDQSIYSWRGANINNILNFEKDYPGAVVVRLNQNYRSRSNIIEAANALIQRNPNRYEKDLWSDLGAGEKIKIYRADNDRLEAVYAAQRIVEHHQQEDIPLKQMVVFYRTNAQSRVFEDCLLQRRIPYVIVGGLSFYQRREIKDVLAWLRMVLSGNDFIAFTRTINLPKRGLGDATLDKLNLAAAQEQCSVLEYCEKVVSGSPLASPVKLTSKQKEGIQDYVQIIQSLRTVSVDMSLPALVTAAIDQTGYWKYLEEDQESMVDRKENLNALVSKAAEWTTVTENPTLSGFLEELSLKSTLDETEGQDDRLNLMTIHNGKGLEFAVTVIAGMEEDLFPHINSREEEERVEEERRLCYVGMTRAKEYLYLSYATSRTIWGVTRTQRPSRFLKEIPVEYVERIGGVGMPAAKSSYNYSKVTPLNPTKVVPKAVQEQVSALSINDLVFHSEFGVGCIKQVQNGSAGLTYTIFFSKDNKERSLVAQYANLTRL
ncbi:MAG: UvrD-helicase domain-containing protein [Parachlamydiaceae bacterium]|nr:UvrD-helicase domain-containing protein [Parachlamydiaceae bacterium]